MRVSKSAVWLKKDRGTHEWQIELVQVLEKLRLFERQASSTSETPQGETRDEPADQPAPAN